MLTGSARTEEESSLVGDADLPSNILPLSEKVNICIFVSQNICRKQKQYKTENVNLLSLINFLL